VPRGDANGETGIVEVADDATTEKSSSAEHCNQSLATRVTCSLSKTRSRAGSRSRSTLSYLSRRPRDHPKTPTRWTSSYAGALCF